MRTDVVNYMNSLEFQKAEKLPTEPDLKQVGSFTYDGGTFKETEAWVAVRTQEYDNRASEGEAVVTFTHTEKVTDSIRTSVIEPKELGGELWVGGEVGGPAPIPGTKGGAKATIKVGAGTTDPHTSTREVEWGLRQEITVPPHRHYRATMKIRTKSQEVDWAAEVQLTGPAIRYKYMNDDRTWSPMQNGDWAYVFSWVDGANIEGYTINTADWDTRALVEGEHETAVGTLRGKVSAKFGVEARVDVEHIDSQGDAQVIESWTGVPDISGKERPGAPSSEGVPALEIPLQRVSPETAPATH
ncbi:hypothetical protein ACFO4E_26960 [Nocardiopsis mangrovi]|uniref:Uncharacterized protein n=1 Tax=Nocardiopsis mangrovi TaxID=1179818 RepID=A0ABV9E778_9ACTN